MNDLLEKFEAKVNKNGPIPWQQELGPCWIWTGATGPNGYGRMGIQRRTQYAHRVAYELYVGPFPRDLQADHLCRVRNCVNPAHIEPVNHAENMKRGVSFRSHKTHCPQGHPYSGDNLYLRPDGAKICVTCDREKSRDWKRRVRAQKRELSNAEKEPVSSG